MSEQNQMFLKLFFIYVILFGAMTFLFDKVVGFDFDVKKSVPLFLLVAAYLSFRRSRKMSN